MSRARKQGWKRRYPRKVVEALSAVTFPELEPGAAVPMPDDVYPKGWLEAAAASSRPPEPELAELEDPATCDGCDQRFENCECG